VNQHVFRRIIVPVTLAAALSGCGYLPSNDAVSPEEAKLSQTNLTALQSTDVKVGTGAEARPGRRVSVHYTGWLYHPTNPDNKGRQFDSSRDRNQTFDLTVGAGEVIPGWDQGLVGMKQGGERRLVIPPGLAYGSRGAGGVIPPNATLVFDIELVGVS
jgi:FKBP-type peptidyl-prolyl cis-trans isomerase